MYYKEEGLNMSNTAFWDGNTLMVCWYGSAKADETGYLVPASEQLPRWIIDPKRKTTGFKLIVDSFNDTMVRYYDERPTAMQALSDLCVWQVEHLK